ncbi:hypothetical protein P280DRAFT_184326 [Massarina eburnea CBS 473.64]|uniref:Uncharacterized protein n=1 Tax=Massarina eburnea CBS 473.64 TaxID=1395130 RepID=A0A6A6SCQ5_9PLEO|nr:hypothetical protein P280DRAFT_184326 [Massarina eburnea CBS 473.64]
MYQKLRCVLIGEIGLKRATFCTSTLLMLFEFFVYVGTDMQFFLKCMTYSFTLLSCLAVASRNW